MVDLAYGIQTSMLGNFLLNCNLQMFHISSMVDLGSANSTSMLPTFY